MCYYLIFVLRFRIIDIFKQFLYNNLRGDMLKTIYVFKNGLILGDPEQ